MKGNSGFTLLELMVGMSVAAILLAVGIPSFTSSVEQNTGVTDANAVLTLLTVARSEAIKRNGVVTLCPSTNGSACDTASSANLAEGYWMYATPSSSSASTTPISLKADVPLTKTSTISASATYATSISFNGLGSAGAVDTSNIFSASAGMFTVTPKNASGAQLKYVRCVSVYQSGRVYVKNPSASFTCS